MNDLISRQAAIDEVRNYYDPEDTSVTSIEERIKRLPSAQLVAKDINVPSNDCISRQAAIDMIRLYREDEAVDLDELESSIVMMPSAQPNEFRKQGEWDMFELITSAWYGKQYYFKEENGMAYSRKSHKTMTVHDAILEFIREIGDE